MSRERSLDELLAAAPVNLHVLLPPEETARWFGISKATLLKSRPDILMLDRGTKCPRCHPASALAKKITSAWPGIRPEVLGAILAAGKLPEKKI